MINIASVFSGDMFDIKGATNASLQRSWHLQGFQKFNVDVFCIQEYWGLLGHFLRTGKIQSLKKESFIIVNDHKVILLWKKNYIIDYILKHKFRCRPLFERFFIKKVLPLFSRYDFISAHMDFAGEICREIKSKNKVPFCITWHGSDIHTVPFIYKFQAKRVKRLIESADYNFFVSEKLLEDSKKITIQGKKCVLYNGVSDIFYQFNREKRLELRRKYGVNASDKVIAFVGGLVPIKNIMLLPRILYLIKKKFKGNFVFWIIGDGKLRSRLEEELDINNIPSVFWGNQPVLSIPAFMNCIDILLLPSKNEGMPLVTLEALACGANVLGSDVGGIKEAIGGDFVHPLNNSFVEDVANHAVAILTNGHVEQKLDRAFSWEETAKKEVNIIYSILNNVEGHYSI